MKFIADGFTHEYNEATHMWECTEGSDVEITQLPTEEVILWIMSNTIAYFPYEDRKVVETFLKKYYK